ncbi:MAG: flavin reductase family protein [Oscillospiraceae bacterium]|nr:flavin reductase family protein [Oscillospiraceae bacterium]
MSKQIWKPGALLAPVPPALVTCGTVEAPNVLTVGWTGILATHPAMTYVSIRPERYSYPLIREGGCFVINLPTEKLARAADFCGVRSGRDTDKFALCGLTAGEASTVSAPVLNESPVNIECRVKEIIELGSHHMFLAEITAIQVDDGLVDENGKLCLDRAGLIAYAHGEYYSLGEKLGTFGWSVRKKKKKPKKQHG